MFIFIDLLTGHSLHVYLSIKTVCPQEGLTISEKCENISPFVFPSLEHHTVETQLFEINQDQCLFFYAFFSVKLGPT